MHTTKYDIGPPMSTLIGEIKGEARARPSTSMGTAARRTRCQGCRNVIRVGNTVFTIAGLTSGIGRTRIEVGPVDICRDCAVATAMALLNLELGGK